jgi:hypothetical protein
MTLLSFVTHSCRWSDRYESHHHANCTSGPTVKIRIILR